MRQETKELELDAIRTDGGTQPRAEIDLAAVAEYAERMGAGDAFPPPEVVFDGKDHWLWDGFHRIHAATKAGRKAMLCNVRAGTLDDARWLALAANKGQNSLRWSSADKRRAVESALKQRPEMSDRAIADHVGVSDKTVSAARDRLESGAEIPHLETRTGKDGKRRAMPEVATESTAEFPQLAEPPAPDDLLDGIVPGETPIDAKEHPIPEPTPNGVPIPKVADPRKPVKDLRGSVVPSIVRDVFADGTLAEARDAVKGWLDALAIDRLMRPINAKLKAFPHLRYEQLTTHLAAAADSLRAAFETIDAAAPYAYCPRCKGNGCDECRNAGYLPRHRYEEIHGGDA